MENKPQVMRGHGLRDALFLLCQEVKVVNESKTPEETQRALLHLEQRFVELIENYVRT